MRFSAYRAQRPRQRSGTPSGSWPSATIPMSTAAILLLRAGSLRWGLRRKRSLIPGGAPPVTSPGCRAPRPPRPPRRPPHQCRRAPQGPPHRSRRHRHAPHGRPGHAGRRRPGRL